MEQGWGGSSGSCLTCSIEAWGSLQFSEDVYSIYINCIHVFNPDVSTQDAGFGTAIQ